MFIEKLRRVQRFPIHLRAPPSRITSPVANISHQRYTFVTIRELHRHVRITPSPQFTSGFILGVFREVFTALKICASTIHSLFIPQLLATLDFFFFFTASLVLSFPKCHIVGIAEYVTFQILDCFYRMPIMNLVSFLPSLLGSKAFFGDLFLLTM